MKVSIWHWYTIAHIVHGFGHSANISGCNMNEYRHLAYRIHSCPWNSITDGTPYVWVLVANLGMYYWNQTLIQCHFAYNVVVNRLIIINNHSLNIHPVLWGFTVDIRQILHCYDFYFYLHLSIAWTIWTMTRHGGCKYPEWSACTVW